MHDFDYDAMQKKRIARGAMNMKRGSKSKKCSLPSDRLTAAQLRRLNGPVSTYKLDEPMDWKSFKAMPEDLQKQYILNLQNTYLTSDRMLAKMFGATQPTVRNRRIALGVNAIDVREFTKSAITIRDAKWAAFCSGVVGGKPGEIEESEKNEEPTVVGEVDKIDGEVPLIEESNAIQQIKYTLDNMTLDIYKPEELSVKFISEDFHADSIYKMIQQMVLPEGRCRIKIEIVKD